MKIRKLLDNNEIIKLNKFIIYLKMNLNIVCDSLLIYSYRNKNTFNLKCLLFSFYFRKRYSKNKDPNYLKNYLRRICFWMDVSV